MDSGFWSAKLIRRLRGRRVRYSITVRQTKTVRAAMATIPEAAWVPIAYQPDGVAQVAETPYRGDRLIVRRVRHQGDQQQLFPTWRYHAFVTNRIGTATWLDADHRRHAMCELAIRDLKAGAGLAHLPLAASPPTRPGCWPPPWPTTSSAGPPASAWAAATSRPSPRRSGRPSSCCPAGSPAPPAGRGCTCPPAGRGPTRSPWRLLGCAAFPTRPNPTWTPRLGWSTRRRPLRPDRHSIGTITPAARPPAGHLTRHIPRPRRHLPPASARRALPASANSDRIHRSDALMACQVAGRDTRTP
jgi:hypothetical protein